MKRTIRLTESRLRGMIREAVKDVLNFASDEPQFDINSDEWRNNYDKMSNDYSAQMRKSDRELTDLQIAHHNGMKGRGNFNGGLAKTRQMSKKGKAESVETIISSGLRRVNGGMSPMEAFSDFEPFSAEQRHYYADQMMLSQYFKPIGTVYGGTYMLIYDTKKQEYFVPNEVLEL